MISSSDAIKNFVKFTAAEQRALDKLEGAIDASLAERFDGSPIRLEFPETIAPKLRAAVQRKYESGGWRVVVESFLRGSGLDNGTAFSFMPLTMPMPPILAAMQKDRLPSIASQQVLVPAPTTRLLVRMPTRGRPAQAIEVLVKYRAMAGIPVTIEIVIDEDDETMMRAEVLQRLHALGCVITVAHCRSKVEAVNTGRITDWDVLLLASDDMVPAVEGYAIKALEELQRAFPHLDGAIYFDDGYQHENCCTLPIMGRRLYDEYGYVYSPEYKSLFCDQEQTEVLRERGRLVYVPEKIIEHKHWVTGAKKDALYLRNDALWEADKATYERRKAEHFYMWPTVLSVLICSLPSRKSQLLRLVDHLWSQARAYEQQVEILVDDREGAPIGTKRQELIARARGAYIAFIDDDDWVAHNYVHRIVHALRFGGVTDADSVALNGVMTTAGAAPEPFYNSIKYTEWFSKDGAHYRTPTHLSPVKRELALKAGFPSISHGEDHAYSQKLRQLVKTEVSAGDAPLYWYFYMPTKKREG